MLRRRAAGSCRSRARRPLWTVLWAIDRGYLDTNPTVNIRARAHGGARERVLSEPELAAIWNACDGDDDFSRIVRLLIFTGQRRAEIGDLAWPEVNLEKKQITLPEARVKNARGHVVPLSNEALDNLIPFRGDQTATSFSAQALAAFLDGASPRES